MRTAVFALLCLTGVVICAQDSRPITLDVVVDSAAVVRSPLSAADFQVNENGEPMTVQSAELVLPQQDTAPLPSISGPSDEKVAAARANHLVGIFVDEYHLQDGPDFIAARAALAAFVRKTLTPRDLVVLVKPLDSLISLRLSADRESAARAIESATARKGDYTPRSDFERQLLAGAPARLDVARTQIAFSVLNALATHLGQFSAGRKTLIALSDGFAGMPTVRGESVLPGPEGVTRSANQAHVAVYAFRPAPAFPPRAAAMSGTPTTIVHDGASSAVPNNAGSPGAREAGARDVGPREAGARDATTASARPVAAREAHDALSEIAEGTTGLVVDGPTATAAGLEHALRDASRYYLLTLAPSPQSASGRFQAVAVAVRAPGGAAVRARAGYRVVKDVDLDIPRVTELPAGMKIPRHSTLLIRTWFGQTAGDDNQTRVAFVWEPAPRVPSARGVLVNPARVTLSVTTMDGVPVFEGTTGPSGRGTLLTPSERPQLSFSAAPGALLVQMDVLDPAGRVLDHDVRDLTLASFKPFALGSAAIFRTRTERELRSALAADLTIAPVAARDFSRSEHLVVRVPVVAAASRPDVRITLKSRFGSAIRQLPVTFMSSSTQPPDSTVIQTDLALSSLASGGYLLQIDAHGPEGTASQSIDFTVTP